MDYLHPFVAAVSVTPVHALVQLLGCYNRGTQSKIPNQLACNSFYSGMFFIHFVSYQLPRGEKLFYHKKHFTCILASLLFRFSSQSIFFNNFSKPSIE